ncbi:hypothetical protein EGM97_18985 [Pseudomonas sp. AF32]|uniref:DUF6124 family protein n=1 Tax=Pseudomonas sp. AF32 TaxID=554390 RepID=UPI001EEE8A9A|nr:hypothetical protein [Pseudomonas sp. AF32]MCG6576784.1 hypothetical protein [Pseudomonas sp. AF32]
MDFYLKPKGTDAKTDRPPGQLFTVIDGIDTESLLANLSESLASVNAMMQCPFTHCTRHPRRAIFTACGSSNSTTAPAE